MNKNVKKNIDSLVGKKNLLNQLKIKEFAITEAFPESYEMLPKWVLHLKINCEKHCGKGVIPRNV